MPRSVFKYKKRETKKQQENQLKDRRIEATELAMDLLCTQDALDAHAHLTLAERAFLVNNLYPMARVTSESLSRKFRENKIKLK
jgi:hypothetical protein